MRISEYIAESVAHGNRKTKYTSLTSPLDTRNAVATPEELEGACLAAGATEILDAYCRHLSRKTFNNVTKDDYQNIMDHLKKDYGDHKKFFKYFKKSNIFIVLYTGGATVASDMWIIEMRLSDARDLDNSGEETTYIGYAQTLGTSNGNLMTSSNSNYNRTIDRLNDFLGLKPY